MAGKFCVSLTCAKDNTDKATVAFVVANAALGSEKETMVFLSTEGVRVAQKGYVDDIHEEGFMPLKELMDVFAEGGGTIYVCAPCFKKREQLDENNLVHGAVMVDGRREAGRVPLRRHSQRHLLDAFPKPRSQQLIQWSPSNSTSTSLTQASTGATWTAVAGCCC